MMMFLYCEKNTRGGGCSKQKIDKFIEWKPYIQSRMFFVVINLGVSRKVETQWRVIV